MVFRRERDILTTSHLHLELYKCTSIMVTEYANNAATSTVGNSMDLRNIVKTVTVIVHQFAIDPHSHIPGHIIRLASLMACALCSYGPRRV